MILVHLTKAVSAAKGGEVEINKGRNDRCRGLFKRCNNCRVLAAADEVIEPRYRCWLQEVRCGKADISHSFQRLLCARSGHS